MRRFKVKLRVPIFFTYGGEYSSNIEQVDIIFLKLRMGQQICKRTLLSARLKVRLKRARFLTFKYICNAINI